MFLVHHPPRTELYTLSLHDALPIYGGVNAKGGSGEPPHNAATGEAGPARALLQDSAGPASPVAALWRSEEHTSELQSHVNLVCRLLLEKKKKKASPNGQRRHVGKHT